ncbi:type I-B CRISPR-associated protein Cas5 [Thermoanaerobacterium sp. PSU-2]|uniref:type I-B CRISPR-associated protein Cas5b n=1 Tax=Thermoanaerobacterium sp. PSU-2 TaxID=1930849 RepID=UPI000A14A74C|nr:type I-B CRISPR-associated protein Cas5b [Thermoanaerobacterium sp. PSU-2]ORX22454.1 type I-B CRISPR-associated protein Cas5 [Thermoanaerobacterium sp. PSU-2]
MKVLRVHLVGWTASFRYPIFITGYQPTLPVPPVSTIYGLISAAKGDYVTPLNTKVGYVMRSEAKGVDLETIYMLSTDNSAKSNVYKREFLLNPDLYLYLTDLSFKEIFKKPEYPLLLGRSSDLMMVEEVKEVDLMQKHGNKRVGGTVVPFEEEGIWGPLQALPMYFSNTIPREAIGIKSYYVLENFIEYDGDSFWYDDELDWGVYLHGQENISQKQ